MPRPKPIHIRFRKMKDDDGQAYINKRSITIDPTLSPALQRAAAIHEVLHLEIWDFKEEAILRIEKSIVDVLKRMDLLCMEKDD